MQQPSLAGGWVPEDLQIMSLFQGKQDKEIEAVEIPRMLFNVVE